MTEFTSTWLQFLARNGALLQGEDGSGIVGFAAGDASDAALTSFVAPLPDLGLIAATGEDAASFLHTQLTNDVEHLGSGEARLAGYCSPKGRLLATFLMWKTADAIMLQLPREIQPAVQKRLQMFVLRAKAKLNDVSDNRVILGLVGHAASAALPAWFPSMPAAPYAKIDSAAGTLIRVADAFAAPRYLWITDVETAQQVWPVLTKSLPPAGSHAWQRSEIHAGVPAVMQKTQEQFVPQMVNFDIIGGVNFKKGCYPGQEIVARTHYLGKVKRRMMLASVDAGDVKPGTEVFLSAEPDQPSGMVVNAAPNAHGGMDCLVEIKTAAVSEGTVHAGSPDGAVLRFGALPYSLPDAAQVESQIR
ncbi:folate-binding protein [Noviherbaspirillum cavernae]|uniref:Folate-binding protein n=1 Tax=Noviherbaspirillum cavernae TaxID=2320862 RepID=A0A418X135_9BURK|nr:folate-binding protein YgfZ [Noviherbaspirillum cavernae]RJG06153.1 folate-binding protein [Noviherbaspirillum cavernae]